MTLQQLIYLREIVRQGKFTAAAETLYVTQSNLSHAITGLENELGVRLLTRGRSEATLTKDGEKFFPYVEKALQAIEEGKTAVKKGKASS